MRRWEKAGKITAIRTPAGHRRYDINLVDRQNSSNSREKYLVNEETIQKIAKGICQYHQNLTKQKLSQYPANLQLAVDKLVVNCLLATIPPLQGVPDFFNRWAQRALQDWDLDINCPEDWHSKSLIEEQRPSNFCVETAEDYLEEYGNFQRKVVETLRLKSFRDRNLYTKFRQYIIENPVITKSELDTTAVIDFPSLKELMQDCYEPAPESYKKDGKFYCCGHCGGLMYLKSNGDLQCENRHCLQYKKRLIPFDADNSDSVMWLKQDLRYFMHRPGKPEVRLFNKLKKLDLKEVILFPNLDTYDLHLVFPDDTFWAVDLKFWESAYNLAKKVDKPIPRWKEQPYKECFFVFPDEIKHYGNEYIQEFRSYCTVPLKKSQVMFEGAFMQKVKIKLSKK
ncbi:restriction endonuclease-related protein [Stanieria cyanosphaera]|uniref:restriction endonuclease-related protein n=1 Tax=Stanieria cyanosphaera TaxID=102116 RepID=UPI0002D4D7A2